MSQSHKGKPSNVKGKKWSLESRQKLSKIQTGRKRPFSSKEKHWNWKGGITPIRTSIWHSDEYKLWREAVFKRDNYTCVFCGKHGGKLNADHIKRFADYPELRFAIDNGRALCVPCHRKTATYGNKKQLC